MENRSGHEEWIALWVYAIIRYATAKNANANITNPVSVYYLRVANVQDGFLDLSEMSQLLVSRDDIKRYAVMPNDMLMNEGGDLDKLGRGALWSGEFSPCIHQNHVFVVRYGKFLLPTYLKAWTGSTAARRYFLLAGRQTTNLASINKTSLGQLPIPLPPTQAEQQAIAEALSDTDALIESLEQLIAKKRQIKQGAMQELLTGQRRLPGFSGQWKVKGLETIADIDPEQLTSKTFPDYEFKYISLEDVDFGSLVSHSQQIFSSAPSRARRKLRKNDLLVSTVRPNLKSHLWFQNDGVDWICSTGFSVIRCYEGIANPGYVFSHLFAANINKQIDALLTGSNYPAINSRDVLQLEIPLPEFDEQVAISGILNDLDLEVVALESKLDKARQIKQSMMQELLTGRIRLI